MVFKYLTILFFLMIADLSRGQELDIVLDISSEHQNLPCKYSHTSKDIAKVYTCVSDGRKIILVNTLDKTSKWTHYSLIKNRFYSGEPTKVIDSKGKSEFLGFTSLSKRGEFDSISGSKVAGRYPWDTLQSNSSSKVFSALGRDLSFSLNKKLDAIYKEDVEAKKLSFKDSNNELLSCQRMKNAPGKTCSFFLCPKDTLVLFNLDYGISITKLSNNSGETRKINTVNLPDVGEIQLGNISTEYSETDFYELLTSPFSTHQLNLDRCQDVNLDEFTKKSEEALKTVKQNLDVIPYKVLVQKIDGVLKTVATIDELSSNYCQYEDIFYDQSKTSLSEVEELLKVKSRNKVYTMKEAQRVFDFFKSQKDLPWDYLNDGCFARAHLGALRVEKKLDIDMDKVWVQGEKLSPKIDPKIIWNYHVAASVNIKDEHGKIISMVIDPSLADRPLRVEEWTELFTDSKNTPLRGSVNSPKLSNYIRPTYTITGNEVFDILELTTGDKLLPAVKKFASKNYLNKINKKKK